MLEKLDCFVPRGWQNSVLFLEYFFHCFSFCEFIDELIEISDITHELIFDFGYFVSTDTPSDEYSIWIENWGFSEKCLEINIFFEYFFESVCIISCEPEYDLIDLGLCSSFFLYFCDIERIDPCDWHGEYFGVLHNDWGIVRFLILVKFHHPLDTIFVSEHRKAGFFRIIAHRYLDLSFRWESTE